MSFESTVAVLRTCLHGGGVKVRSNMLNRSGDWLWGTCRALWRGRPRSFPAHALELAQLESRILLSAAPLPAPLPPTGDLADLPATPQPAMDVQQVDAGAQQQQTRRLEVAFVDANVEDYQGLLEDLRAATDDSRTLEVWLLDGEQDGIEQISQILQGYSDLDAIHLVSHAADGRLRLGNAWISNQNVEAYAGQLALWNNSVRSDADLLIYGCDLAASVDGRDFAEALGVLSGMDVAASVDETGSSTLGGDWNLEWNSGAIETRASSSELWAGLLSMTPVGSEVRVNTTTAGGQQTFAQSPKAVAMAPNGDYVVTWADQAADGSGWGVYAQRYNSAGVAQGTEFRVNKTITDDQTNPTAAMDANGNFVITWSSFQNGTDYDIYARRFDANGNALGNDFRVNNETLNHQQYSSVAMDASGDFVITWASQNQDSNSWGVFARRYNASGSAQGSEFQVNTWFSGAQQDARVAMDAAGNFVIAWSSNNQDGNSWGVFAQRYNAAGVAQGSEFQVNTTFLGNQQNPALDMDDSGNFVIAWASNTDLVSWGVYAQRYNSAGIAQGSEFLVNTTSLNSQLDPSVALNSSGGFVISWDSLQSGNWDVYARQFDSTGGALGSEFRVNTTTNNSQQFASAAAGDSNVAIVWSSLNQDGSGYGVYAQDYNSSGILVSPVSGLITTEAGGTASFTVKLAVQPTANVTIGLSSSNPAEGSVSTPSLTFTPANWNGTQTVTITGLNDFVADGDATYSIVLAPASSADPNFNNAIGPRVYAVNQNDDVAGVTVSPVNGLKTKEDGTSDTFAVVLTSQPLSDVTIPISSSDTTEGTVSTTLLTFTSANWNVVQTVTVTGVDDFVDDGNVNYTILTGQSSSADPLYDKLVVADVSAQNQNDDQAGFTVTPITGLTTTEAGGTASFSIVLHSQPTNTVTIDLSSSIPTEGSLSANKVTFTAANWNVPHIVTVTGVNDFVDDGDIDYTIITANSVSSDPKYNNKNVQDVDLTNLDDDTAGFAITPLTGLTTTEAGGTATISVALTSKPLANVTLPFSSSNLAEGLISTASLTFTTLNWNVAQTVTVSGVNDAVDDGDILFSAITGSTLSNDNTYKNIDPADVAVTNLDDDTVGISLWPSAVASGQEFQVNTEFERDQLTFAATPQAVAMDRLGNYVVTWSSKRQDNNDTWGIYAQRFNAAGEALGSEFRVNTTTVGDQQYSSVAMDDNGNFVIAWASKDQDGNGWGIYARRYDSNGTALSGEFLVNTVTNRDQLYPAVAMNGAGSFVISWSSQDQDPNNWNVYGQRYDSNGVQSGIQFQVNSTLGKDQKYSTVAMDDAGNFVVAWRSSNQDGSGQGVIAQRFDASGVRLGGEFQVNTTPLKSQQYASVAMAPDGDYVITWSSIDQDGNGWGVYGQRYRADGAAQGGEFRVNTTTSNDQLYSTVAMDAAGNFVITWSSNGQDGNGFGVYGQRYSALGVPLGNQFRVNTTTAGNQQWSSVAMADNGTFVTVWSSSNQDGDGWGVFGQLYKGTDTTESGTTATIQVVLNSEPTANVIVTINNSDVTEGTAAPINLTFKNTNWNVPQTVTITGQDDALLDGDILYTLNATASSNDPLYDNLPSPDTWLINRDNDTPGVRVTPVFGLETTEAGGTAQFTIVLESRPTSNVTITVNSSNPAEGTVSMPVVTFTTGNWSVAQTVTVTGVDDPFSDGDVSYSIILSPAISLDANYNGLDPDDVTIANLDDDSSAILVTPTTGLATSEGGGSDTFSVVLANQPTADVVIGLSSSDPGEGTLSTSSLTFTSADWDTPQTVTVTGANDFSVDGNVVYTIVTTPAISADLSYNNVDAADVEVTNVDDDASGISVVPVSGLVTSEDGTSASFSIVLNSLPLLPVSIGISSSNPAEGTVSTSSVTFGLLDWNIPQTVTITGVNDFSVDGTASYSIVTAPASSLDLFYNGADAADVQVTNLDDDFAGIVVSPLSGPTSEAGGSATFSVVLTSRPAAAVTIGLSSSNPSEGIVSSSSLTFTSLNWNAAQTVTVTGVDDLITDGSISYTIVTSPAVSTDPNYANLNAADVGATNLDNDLAGITTSLVSGPTTENGGTATFTVVLNSQPTADVSINLSSSDPSEGTLSTNSLTFTAANWNVARTVTVTGMDDLIADGSVSYAVQFAPTVSADTSYDGITASSVSVTNLDNDVSGVIVSAISGPTTEAGGTASFTVALNSQPIADVTISISSSDAGEGTTSASSLTFTSANWNIAQTVTVTGVSDVVVDGNVNYQILTGATVSSDPSYNGQDPADVDVINLDNNAPLAADDAYMVNEDGVLFMPPGGVLNNDVDLDVDPLTAVLVSGPVNGVLALNADGSFVYTPNTEFHGIDSFTYRASDGAANSTIATATINVLSVNDAPTANNDTYNVNEDQSLTVPVAGALGNDSDVDGDPITAALVSGPSRGALTFNVDGSFSYTPNANFQGIDSFTYRADDGTASQLATVTINVNPVNDPPTATDGSFAIDNDQTLVLAAPGLLASAVDIDADLLALTIVTLPANGTLAWNADGSITYTPDATFNGTDVFTYTASDGGLVSNLATVTIDVRSAIVPLPPSAVVPTPADPIESQRPAAPRPAPAPKINPQPTVSEPSVARPEHVLRAIPIANTVATITMSPVSRELSTTIAPAIAALDPLVRLEQAVRRFPQAVAESTAPLVAAFNSSLLWEDLAQLKHELSDKADVNFFAAGSAVGVTSVLTAGYVLWTVRGGWLVAGLLAQMPAWRLVDPLVVLDYLNEEENEKRDEDDSLEGMLEKKGSTQ